MKNSNEIAGEPKMHEYEISIRLDEEIYIYRYKSPIPLSNGVVVKNIGNNGDINPIFIVTSMTIDLTGDPIIEVAFNEKSDEEKISKWQSFVRKNWIVL